MKNKFLLILLCSFSIYSFGQIKERSAVDSIFLQWNKSSSPGTAIGIIKDGKLLYSNGYGIADLEHNIHITDTTLFYIGSVSKQFTAMCVLLLEEQGKLSLDDNIQKYLPDFPDYGHPITIRNFLNHTSGVRDNLTLWSLAGKDYLDHIDKMEMYDLIRRQKELNFKSGEQFMYSNSCYFMLGLVIEKIAGEPLKEFARKNIFQPLGMHSTFFQDDNSRIIKNRAFSYVEENGVLKNQIMRYDLVGSGGIYTNIRDLYLWDQNFYHNKLGKEQAHCWKSYKQKAFLAMVNLPEQDML
jgi:CubicO group peptidase (beta-lactamase class C family)